jgi:hypothetical protein
VSPQPLQTWSRAGTCAPAYVQRWIGCPLNDN